jgi:hypothetical protein
MGKSTDIQSKEEVNFADSLLSVVVPAYNEEEVSPEFHKRISAVLKTMSMEAITSFTITPLKIATYFGLLSALAAFIYAGIIIYQTSMVIL